MGAGAPGSVLHAGWRSVRRAVIALFGVSVLVVGAAMIVLPGPAVVVIPAGLAILATEFLWARRLLRRLSSYVPGRKEGDGRLPARADEPSRRAVRPAGERARSSVDTPSEG